MIRQAEIKSRPSGIRQKMTTILMMVTWVLLISCHPVKKDDASERIKVIFDTDIGGDIDDALALAMLYNYMDLGWIELLGVMSCKDNSYSPGYIDIMNNWYGYPELPVGIVKDGVKHDTSAYARLVTGMKKDGVPVYARSIPAVEELPSAANLYRKLLSESPDSSVVIIAVGQSTNLARLLASGPDEYSRLPGHELVALKVDFLSLMAGSFQELRPETNIILDSASAARVLAYWPTDIWFSPYDVGLACPYPGKSIQNDFAGEDHHPLVVAYESYQPMPYDRPTWDLTSVLFGVERDSAYFTTSPPGRVSLAYEPDIERHVVTRFSPDPMGKHFYLSVDEAQAKRIRKRLVEMVTMDPSKK